MRARAGRSRGRAALPRPAGDAGCGASGEPLAVVGQHRVHVAEHAVVEELPDHVEAWQVERPHRLGAEHPPLRSPFRDLRCLRLVQRERLLHQHVLARLERKQGVPVVEVVRRGDVDDVDLGIGDEIGVRAVGPPDPDPPGELLRRRHRPRPGRDHLLAGVAAQGTGELLRDPAGAQHTPAQRRCVHRVGQPGGRECARETHRSPSLRSVGNDPTRCDIDSLASSLIAPPS